MQERQPSRALALALLAASAAVPAAAQNLASFTAAPEDAAFRTAPATLAADCATLRAEAPDGVTILSAEMIGAEGERPAFCRLSGVIDPAIEVEISLPEAWNRRLYMFGNGGYAGENLADPRRTGLRDTALGQGFAVVQQNSGHDAATEPLGTFADGNLPALLDYAFRGVHEAVRLAKTMAEEGYGRPPAYSYWDGCSTGGRQGLMSAQRFPGDFDGILAGAPVLDFTGTQMWGVWNAQALDRVPIPSALLPTLAQAVAAKCDAVDGLEDGLITDPRQCEFDPAADLPRCEGEGGEGCFTNGQIEALQSIAGGIEVGGETAFPGVPWGVEGIGSDGQSGWNLWIVSDEGPSRQLLYGETFLQNMATLPKRGTDLDWRSYDIAGGWESLGPIRGILDATNPDLSGFAGRGGKMITYFGWADPALNPQMGVDYYESVREEMGAEETAGFYRLFMVPGMFHCRGGYGPDRFDAMTPLIDWVERGIAPETIEAAQMQGEETVRTRPLCAYPAVAVHDGAGSPHEAASFSCEAPAD